MSLSIIDSIDNPVKKNDMENNEDNCDEDDETKIENKIAYNLCEYSISQ